MDQARIPFGFICWGGRSGEYIRRRRTRRRIEEKIKEECESKLKKDDGKQMTKRKKRKASQPNPCNEERGRLIPLWGRGKNELFSRDRFAESGGDKNVNTRKMQEMGVGQTRGRGVQAWCFFRCRRKLMAPIKQCQKLTLLPNELIKEKQYNFFCAITPYYILYDESYDDTAWPPLSQERIKMFIIFGQGMKFVTRINPSVSGHCAKLESKSY